MKSPKTKKLVKNIKNKKYFEKVIVFTALVLIFFVIFFLTLLTSNRVTKNNHNNISVNQIDGLLNSSECKQGVEQVQASNFESQDYETKRRALKYLVGCYKITNNYTEALKYADEWKNLVAEKGSETELVRADSEVESIKDIINLSKESTQ